MALSCPIACKSCPPQEKVSEYQKEWDTYRAIEAVRAEATRAEAARVKKEVSPQD